MTERVVTDFVAGMVNMAIHQEGTISAASQAAHAVRGPGAEELRTAVGGGGGDLASRLEELAERWGSPLLASVAVAVRTGGVGTTVGGHLLERAQTEASRPSPRQRAAAEFVVGYLDALAGGAGLQAALEIAAGPLRGLGADELVEAANIYGRTVDDSAERLGHLAEQWESPVLASLATALRAGGPGPARRAYLLVGAQAVVSGDQLRITPAGG